MKLTTSIKDHVITLYYQNPFLNADTLTHLVESPLMRNHLRVLIARLQKNDPRFDVHMMQNVMIIKEPYNYIWAASNLITYDFIES